MLGTLCNAGLPARSLVKLLWSWPRERLFNPEYRLREPDLQAKRLTMEKGDSVFSPDDRIGQ